MLTEGTKLETSFDHLTRSGLNPWQVWIHNEEKGDKGRRKNSHMLGLQEFKRKWFVRFCKQKQKRTCSESHKKKQWNLMINPSTPLHPNLLYKEQICIPFLLVLFLWFLYQINVQETHLCLFHNTNKDVGPICILATSAKLGKLFCYAR